ncbi:MAG: hypothetical protein EZS28_045263 [Streblomastix strix]|uniref:Uncharacterized protein n=1 Tax=Streblomastix strix TaxID=222440 RepID=A0A5J4TMZ4_9EUKA|nr:MAG: hypothetical protein EZS28_045263 [Streblomastix strix]
MPGGQNNEIQKLCIESGIIKSLLDICSSRNLNQITYPYIGALASFTYPSSFQMIQLLYQLKPFPSLLRLLDRTDENIVYYSMNAIDNIIYYGAIGTDSTSIHPYYEDLNQLGGIEKIFSLFRRTQDEFTKIVSATCLGIVFRAREMTDPEMKVEIISHLKSIINHENEDIKKLAQLALKCLAIKFAN